MVTLNILLDGLSEYTYHTNINTNHRIEFKGVILLAPNQKQLSSGFLYICNLSDALSLNLENTGTYFFCINDLPTSPVAGAQELDRIVLFEKAPDLISFYNKVQSIFTKIENWDNQMLQSILKDQGIQGLITLSESIIGNHISVSDPSLKMLAVTWGIPALDRVSKDLIKYGYHCKESLDIFKTRRAYEDWANTDSVVLREPTKEIDYQVVLKPFKHSGTYSVLVVMVITNTPYTQGLLDLFKMLTTRVSYYVERDYSTNNSSNYVYSSFFIDIIEKRLNKKEDILGRSSYVGIPYNGNFSILVIAFDDVSNTPLNRVLNEVHEALPLSKGIVMQNSLILLKRYINLREEDRREALNSIIDRLEPILSRYSANCGVSTPFFELIDMPVAYTQSTLALQYGQMLKKRSSTFKDLLPILAMEQKGFFKYDDYFMYHMIDICKNSSESVIDNIASINYIRILDRYDKERKTDNIRLLYVYLLYERNATVVANMLHMHRNNVLYRVRRIEEIVKIDLEDPDLRFKMILAYKYWELYNTALQSVP